MTPNPIVLSKRPFSLRAARPGDAPALARFARDNFERFEPWLPVPPRHALDAWALAAIEESQRCMEAGNELRFMLFALPEGQRIHGHVMLTRIDENAQPACMLSYAIDRGFEGRGIMREAVAEVIQFAFESLALSSVGARYRLGNERSARLLTRLGFEHDSALRRHPWLGEVPESVLVVKRAANM